MFDVQDRMQVSGWSPAPCDRAALPKSSQLLSADVADLTDLSLTARQSEFSPRVLQKPKDWRTQTNLTQIWAWLTSCRPPTSMQLPRHGQSKSIRIIFDESGCMSEEIYYIVILSPDRRWADPTNYYYSPEQQTTVHCLLLLVVIIAHGDCYVRRFGR